MRGERWWESCGLEEMEEEEVVVVEEEEKRKREGGGRGSPSGLPPSGSSTLNSLAVTHQSSLAHHTMPGTVI